MTFRHLRGREVSRQPSLVGHRISDGPGEALPGPLSSPSLAEDRPMDRRRFLEGTLVGAAALAAAGPAPGREDDPPKKPLMKAGHQNHSSDADLRVLAALGVNHICSALPSRTFDDNWSVEALTRLRQRVEGFDIKLDMVPLPL